MRIMDSGRCQLPGMQARVEALVREPDERIKATMEIEFQLLRNRAANEDLNADGRAQVELRLRILMAHAKWRGWIVEKKQNLSARVNLGQSGDLVEGVGAFLDSLEPGSRRAIESRVRRITERRSKLVTVTTATPVTPVTCFL